MGTTALARRFRADVTSDLTLASGFSQLPGITDFNPQITPTKTDATTYDSNGWTSTEIPLNAWSVTVKALRQPVAGVYPPAQELVRACQGQFGNAARVGIRWYAKDGAPEAWQGVAIAEWNESKTGVADLNEVQMTFTGDGILTAIANPGTAATAPVLFSATPSGVATGGLLTITGVGFTGVTGASHVTIGGVNATSYVVISDNTIVAVMPAGSAGSAPVVVTNTVGASNSLPYTRG